MRVILRTFSTF